jgi:hypothetical protein
MSADNRPKLKQNNKHHDNKEIKKIELVKNRPVGAPVKISTTKKDLEAIFNNKMPSALDLRVLELVKSPEKQIEWIKDQGQFEDLFRGIMFDPIKAEGSMWTKLKIYVEEMNIPVDSIDKFKSEYKIFYLKNIDAYQECLKSERPDYNSMINVTKIFYENEESFLKEYLNESEMMKFNKRGFENKAKFLARLKFYSHQSPL